MNQLKNYQLVMENMQFMFSQVVVPPQVHHNVQGAEFGYFCL
jgi:hypothetical protein